MSKKIEEIITEMSESGHLGVKEDICKDAFRIQMPLLPHGLPQWRRLRMR